MPIHDWTRVNAGTWHDMHHNWTGKIRDALNEGLLPKDYYALSEQRSRSMQPDLLALEATDETDEIASGGGTATLAPPFPVSNALAPKTKFYFELDPVDQEAYAGLRRSIVIRHANGDRIVALLELVSPGNKSSTRHFNELLEKLETAIDKGIHVTLVDLFPPTPRDPHGIHNALWERLGGEPIKLPADLPLTLAAYDSERTKAYVETTAVGRALVEFPIFLKPGAHILLPLEQTYLQAYQGFPQRWKKFLEAPEPITSPPRL